ncbi:MAG: T9SS type A sorting domain-containing protein, partial [bacterium]|nr:T9SS type A sorting domain-containing protein [bacterium]
LAGDVIPTRPGSRSVALASAEWELAGTTLAGTLTFDDIWADATNRGVYYYEVFAVDAAMPGGNNSSAAAANDRATNYWLGDTSALTAGYGTVDLYDMTNLGDAFGTSHGDGSYNNIVDVGPTDDWSRVGIPTTDNNINFEDLMVYSMNFGVVTPTNKAKSNISRTADMSWVRYDEGSYALRLNEATGLKGVHLSAVIPQGATVTVSAGSLLDEQNEMTFLRNVGTNLDASLAVTGMNQGFVGQGDLILVNSSVELAMGDLIIELRGSDNSEIEISLNSESGTLTPRVFNLNAAYPNPFNPMTKISFSLPESQEVRLSVYGVDGKLVRTLVNEARSAGLHEVIWNGQNDAGQVQASGLYFYRIEAGPYSQVRKMTLMK